MQNFTASKRKKLESRLKYRLLTGFLLLLSGGLYYVAGYHVNRSDFEFLFGLWLALFALYLIIQQNKGDFKFNQLFAFSIALRLILLFAIPALSNDFFRFIWDGEIMANGINPFAHKPDELISYGGFLDEPHMRKLYHGMGELSQQHYTCYPPLSQFLFVIPALISNSITTQLIILKLILIAADAGSILVGSKILRKLNLNPNSIWLFAFNPLVILELSGNVHFEGVMIFFLLSAVWLLLNNQWIFSTVFFAFAIHVKLVPLIFLPLLLKKIGLRKTIVFVSLTGLLVLGISVILMNNIFLSNMMQSVNEYFVHFEFNASVFYIVREIGFYIKGYDIVASAGPALSVITLLTIASIAFFRKYERPHDVMTAMLWAISIYFVMTTTVHPWYITTVLAISVFTQYRFAVVWSFVVFLSYHAYQQDITEENGVLVIIEYVCLFAVMIYELVKHKPKFGFQLNNLIKGTDE
ncbi:MAG: DUF2029 domain-containing protein [Crocinitomicaceae bacterium]|nr:DUF2029 domain-containing protein [Crocinitomicaceae bacterium]